MKPVHKCDFCHVTGTIEEIIKHEGVCKYNPMRVEQKAREEFAHEHCTFCKRCWDEYDSFWGCIRKGNLGRHTPQCEPIDEVCNQFYKRERSSWNNI